MNYILLFVLIFILWCVVFQLFNKEFLSPTVIFVGVFGVSVLGAGMGTFMWNHIKIGNTTLALVLLGLVGVMLGEILVRKIFDTRKIKLLLPIDDKKAKFSEIQISWKKTLIVCIYMLVVIVTVFATMNDIVNGNFVISEVISSYRARTPVSNIDYQVTRKVSTVLLQFYESNRAICVVYIYVFVNNIMKKNNYKRNIINLLPIIICCMGSMLLSGRSVIMKNILICIFIGMLIVIYKSKRINIKLLIKITLCVVLLVMPAFYFMIEILGRDIEAGLFSYVTFYMGCAIPSLEVYLVGEKPVYDAFGYETLLGIQKLLSKFNSDIVVNISSLPYVALGDNLSSNCYTPFRRYYQDFGYIGVVICSGMFGAGFSIVNEFVKRFKHPLGIMIYGSFLATLVNGFREEVFFRSIINYTFVIHLVLIIMFYKLLKIENNIEIIEE